MYLGKFGEDLQNIIKKKKISLSGVTKFFSTAVPVETLLPLPLNS